MDRPAQDQQAQFRMFSQQASAGRGAPGLGATRLQNGKLGTASGSWFGAAGGSSNTPAQSSRPNVSLASFAQTISGQQSSLDLSEFPSLGASAQQQQQNSSASQALWSNPTIRASNQQSAVQRPQSSAPPQSSQDDSSQFGPGSEAYRFGSGGNGLAGLAQSPSHVQGMSEEFPPLGGLGSSEVDRRSSLLSGFGGQSILGSQSVLGGQSLLGGQSILGGQSVLGGQGLRLGLNQGSDMGLRDRNPTPRGRTITNPNPFPAPPESSQSPGLGLTTGPIGYKRRFEDPGSVSGIGPDLMFNPREPLTLSSPALGAGRGGATPAQQKRLKDMSPREFHGLTGLAALIDPSHPDHNPYHIGHDITQLGLDLNSSEPLHKTFSTPFGPSGSTSRPAVPDFTLPASYKVANVPALHTKISSFSDEALFACFYQHPRDLAQELAAAELYRRDWRWHKILQHWLQKDSSPGMTAPQSLGPGSERGIYVCWDVQQWRKVQREMVLVYKELEQRHGGHVVDT